MTTTNQTSPTSLTNQNTIETVRALLSGHDWFASYSDSPGATRKSSETLRKVCSILLDAPAEVHDAVNEIASNATLGKEQFVVAPPIEGSKIGRRVILANDRWAIIYKAVKLTATTCPCCGSENNIAEARATNPATKSWTWTEDERLCDACWTSKRKSEAVEVEVEVVEVEDLESGRIDRYDDVVCRECGADLFDDVKPHQCPC